MTNLEWAEFVGKLHDLWPNRELNEAQVGEWRSRVFNFNGYDAVAALGDYFAAEKKAADGPVPSLSAFNRCYYARVRKHEAKPVQPDESRKPIGRFEFYKQAGRFAHGSSLSDAEIAMRVEHETFIEHCLLYGPDKPGVVRQFRRWQDAVAASDGDRQDWDGEYWSHWRNEQRPANSENHAEAFGMTLAELRLRGKQRLAQDDEQRADPPASTLAEAFAKA